ncbi:hypothetical protein C7434_3446 [Pantoea sp. PNA 14-12]|uniref:hypothetical protein n=1 Tax=Pantoea TaxID=53335 RepID=UPI00105C9C0D|nr:MULTISPECIES: hypothetical protein [Pantoea]TDS67708.1 hypothetical protein C7434_3446 [Pantoea sp. PNA 14-12]
MKNREAAEFVTETLLALTALVTTSVQKIYDMNKDGKVSSEEAALYRQSLMDPLDKMLGANLEGIFEQHPEMRPQCTCCESQQEEKMDD